MSKQVKDLSKFVGTVAREEIRGHVTPDELLAEVTRESDGSKENQEFFEKVGVDVELAVNGVTNRIALMIDGTIPSSYRDMAVVYRRMAIAKSQIDAIMKKAKEAIVTDPTAPDAFYVGATSYTLEVTTRNGFNKALFKKDDPLGYGMLYGNPKYQKKVLVNKLTFKAIGGGK